MNSTIRKCLLVTIGSIFSLLVFSQTSGTVSFGVTTADLPKAAYKYSPLNVVAIWITNENGTFVRSLKVMAAARIQHLVAWNASSAGNKVDAVTGSTLNTAQTHNVTWDCKDVNGVLVADGKYKINIEFTSANSSSGTTVDGPLFSYVFTKGIAPITAMSLTDETYYKNMSISYTPSTVNIKEEASLKNELYPNPAYNELNLILNSNESVVSVSIANLLGLIVLEEKVNVVNNRAKIDVSTLKSGGYLLTVNSEKLNFSETLLIRH